MADNQTQIKLLQYRLQLLSEKQNEFLKEINYLQTEILRLKTQIEGIPPQQVPHTGKPVSILKTDAKPEPSADSNISPQKGPITSHSTPPVLKPFIQKGKVKTDIEKFIGENLINKIGIAITVIGVAIGTKYAIDHQLISPLTRIILGYLAGIGLLGFALKLKIKYENFSAVLLSGAMAILYFITYAAFAYYQLIPQILAFTLMVLFTAFTVLAAIHYNRQAIAIIGMVGAYGVPFLLSDGSGNVSVLFTYMAIINMGILAIAIKKYWKPLHHLAFGLTWIIYLVWCVMEYRADKQFSLALLFLFIFFATFYLTFLSYKLIKNEKFRKSDVVSLLLNSFLFYGTGYALLNEKEAWGQYLGLFTLCNAVIHFIVCFVIYRRKLADRNLFYLVSGLVLVFITITIPVQLNGSWVTLMWAGEAALLFWIGRTKNVNFYEKLSYPIMGIAFISLAHDWTTQYYKFASTNASPGYTPLFNIYFLTSVLFIAAFYIINIVDHDKRYIDTNPKKNLIAKVFSFLIPAILVFVIYNSFRVEIEIYWTRLYFASSISAGNKNSDFSGEYYNTDLLLFRTIWVINYSLAFVSALALFNLKKIQNKRLGLVSLSLVVISIMVFLTQGLYSLSLLRDSFLNKSLSQYYHQSSFSIGIRYISFAFVSLAIFSAYKYLRGNILKINLTPAFDALLYITILWVASSELINWMGIAQSTQSYKLGLSILWGIYSLVLIIQGISNRKQYLRIGAIVLFGVTLIKLFFYDISHLDTISKTVVFVSLGILLLVISFLYNKYKSVITDENKA